MSGLSESRWAPRPEPGGSEKPTPSYASASSSSSSRVPNGRISITGVSGVGGSSNAVVYSNATRNANGNGNANRNGNATAPAVAPTSSTSNANANSAQELSRFIKLVARLKWKLPFLEAGYRRATLHASSPSLDGSRSTPPLDTDTDTDIHYAETMFKIDFHEYYALLERAIVHLLGVFGVRVSSTPVRKWRGKKIGQGVQWNTTTARPGQGGAAGGGGGGGHSYHANVLETLEDPACPLYEVLGVGSVQEQLRKAKELRNRWKTADNTPEEEQEEEEKRGTRRRQVLPLESYDFDQILNEIFGGLEEGYLLAQAHVAKVDGDGMNAREVEMEMDGDWDFIVEAMDWEAI